MTISIPVSRDRFIACRGPKCAEKVHIFIVATVSKPGTLNAHEMGPEPNLPVFSERGAKSCLNTACR